MSGLKILYEDKYLTITEASLTIKKYYFPLGTSKTIMFNEMKKISIEDGSMVKHSWGINGHYLNNWFHLDSQRSKKSKFISIEVKGARIRPSITPTEIDKAFDVLRQHFSSMQKKSVMFESNRGKQTQLQQRQAEEMAKQQKQFETSESQLKKCREVKVENLE